MENQLTVREATEFFSKLFYGEHHIPRTKQGRVHEHGFGFCVNYPQGAIATYDGDTLTRFVLLCHQFCYRGEVSSYGFKGIKLAIWKRSRTGQMCERHPTIEDVLSRLSQ